MGKALVLRPLAIAAASADSSAAGHLPAYAVNDHAGIVWKSFGGASADALNLDLGAGNAKAIDLALFFGCTGATTSWQLSVAALNDDLSVAWASASAQFLAGSTPPSHGRGVGYWRADPASPPPAKRHWRFTFSNLGGAQVTIARAAIGQAIALERNFAFGAAFGVRDLGRVEFSPMAALLRRRAARLRVLGLSFPAVRKDEAEGKIQPLLELSAGQEPIALVTDPDAHALRQQRCWMGWLEGELGTVWPRPSGFEWRANLVDMIPIPKAV
jgi:hypothetical protein